MSTPRRKGKYLGHVFNADQQRARAIWKQAESDLVALHEALLLGPFKSRAKLHARLDQRLDALEQFKANAIELFPEVEESWTISTMRFSASAKEDQP